MKVVFLDVDGVLNYSGCKEKYNGLLGVTDEGLDRLAEIVFSCSPPAAIVLTSSWKAFWDNRPMKSKGLDPMALYLIERLKSRGLHLTDRTQEKTPSDRGMGIKGWLRKVSDIDAWVVLDDDVFPDYGKYDIGPHLVKTSFDLGLTDQSVEKAIRILHGE